MLSKFKIAETQHFAEKMSKEPFRSISAKIREYIYPQLRTNPFWGTNIKKLKGEFEEVYRYRTGNFRLFYVIEKGTVVVMMIDIEPRKDSYR